MKQSMKAFLSSVIGGYGVYREAVVKACQTLKIDLRRSEDYGASPSSPQEVCLAGVRDADTLVLVLGSRYGELQPSGLSGTHEEYREARERMDILVFVQEAVKLEIRQQEFVREVQAWAGGHYTAAFNTPGELNEAVLEALHRLQVARACGAADEADLMARAAELTPDVRSIRDAALCVVVTGGPRLQILRPAEIERLELRKGLQKEALFGECSIFEESEGVDVRIEQDGLLLQQESGSLLLNQLGAVRVVLPASRAGGSERWTSLVLIEEEIQARLTTALRFAAWVLDHVDPKAKLTHVVPVATLLGAAHHGWKTRAEERSTPGSYAVSMHGERALTVRLVPPSRLRSVVKAQAAEIAEDFVTMFRRKMRT